MSGVRQQRAACGLAILPLLGLLCGCSADDPDTIQVYFGCGCFWHMQHELVTLEESLLHHSGSTIQARTAYAGGRDAASSLVCYHDGGAATDYGLLGHAEAVALTIPKSDFPAFAARFWELCPQGERRDFQDVGAEYRSIVGLPGGMKSPLMPELMKNAGKTKVVEGHGSDDDTLSKNTVYVYDTANFRAHIAEKYHQFHDDMIDKYGPAYNSLRQYATKTQCAGDQHSFSLPSLRGFFN